MYGKKKLLRRKSWFLTYPAASELSKETLLEFFLSKFEVKEYVIAEEKHKNQDKHFHVYLLLEKKLRFSKNLFDCEQYHGNYQPAKSKLSVIKYICKEDKEPLTNINIEALKKKKAKTLTKQDYIKNPIELLEEGKITFFQISSFLQNQNLYKLLSVRHEIDLNLEKKRHFWYWGQSNSGKTYLLKSLISKEEKDWFQMPLNNDWNGYYGQKNLYLDEFKGQLSIQELNRLCDGGAKVNTKGSTLLLRSDVVVWIFSNYDISSCYKNCDENILETLNNRFNVIEKVRFCANNITAQKRTGDQ